jgi:hypothetical protein
MRSSGIAALAALIVLAGSVAPRAEQRPVERAAVPASHNKIDDLVFARLKRLGLQAAPLSSDAVFVRRVYLDTIGTLPTADEARAFLADQDANKRSQLIDALLEREEFAEYWAMKWSDLLRVKSEFPINLWPNAVQAYHHWILASVRDNVPYDRFVRTLLTESGSNFRVGPVNFYRAVQSREPQALASAVALTFMGARADKWPAERLTAMSAFFSQVGYKSTQEWKEEIVFFDPNKTPARSTAGSPRTATLPDGTTVKIPPDQDPREVFAAWLITPNNPWFTRNIANRVWSWLLGRGVIHEPDDIRPDNPPSNPELLALLEHEIVGAHYDLKHLYRLILNSATYQLAATAADPRPEGDVNFSHYLARPIDAEVLIDAIDQITGASEPYSSAIPEPFTFTPLDQRAIALADGSITSTFLVTFGRPARDTGLESERNSRPTAAERLALLNSSNIQRKIDQSLKLQALIAARVDLRQAIANLYLTILSRFPTDDEVKVASAYAQTAGGNRRVAGLDLAWALINSEEFLYRH